ncbi:NUDIX hydrolase, partial [Listeria grayi]
MRSLEEKTISETTIYKGKIIDLTVADVLLPDGNQAKRELVKHPGAVAIIPVIDDKLVLVEQFRKTIG